MRFLVFVFVVFWSASALADDAVCEYDPECPDSKVCVDGQCVDESDAICPEGDRQCRIRLLKRRNKARRMQRVLREEETVRYTIEQRRKEAAKANPRIEDRITAGLRVSTFSPLGFGVGYGFTPEIRAEFQFAHQEGDVFTSELDGFHEGSFFNLSAVWIPFDAWATVYGSAGIVVFDGMFSPFRGFAVERSSGELETIYHALAVGGGFDIQFVFGLHTRLGVEFRPLLYNQAKFEPGVYDADIRSGLQTWFSEDMTLDLVWLMGWAF